MSESDRAWIVSLGSGLGLALLPLLAAWVWGSDADALRAYRAKLDSNLRVALAAQTEAEQGGDAEAAAGFSREAETWRDLGATTEERTPSPRSGGSLWKRARVVLGIAVLTQIVTLVPTLAVARWLRRRRAQAVAPLTKALAAIRALVVSLAWVAVLTAGALALLAWMRSARPQDNAPSFGEALFQVDGSLVASLVAVLLVLALVSAGLTALWCARRPPPEDGSAAAIH